MAKPIKPARYMRNARKIAAELERLSAIVELTPEQEADVVDALYEEVTSE